jgi:hypothetical protein
MPGPVRIPRGGRAPPLFTEQEPRHDWARPRLLGAEAEQGYQRTLRAQGRDQGSVGSGKLHLGSIAWGRTARVEPNGVDPGFESVDDIALRAAARLLDSAATERPRAA